MNELLHMNVSKLSTFSNPVCFFRSLCSNSSQGSSQGSSSGSRVTLPPSYDDVLKEEDGYLAPIPTAKHSDDEAQSPRKSQQQQQQQQSDASGNLRRSQVEPLHILTTDNGSGGGGSGSGSASGSGSWQQHLSPTKQSTTSPKPNEGKVKMR